MPIFEKQTNCLKEKKYLIADFNNQNCNNLRLLKIKISKVKEQIASDFIVNKMNRNFFNNNTVQNYQTYTKEPFYKTNKSNFRGTNKLKRVASCSNSSKLNPQKFINRQAFNNKLYSEKPFNIAVQFNKQKREQFSKLYSFNDNQTFSALAKTLRKETDDQLRFLISTISNHLKTVHEEIQAKGYEVPKIKSLQNELILLKQGYQKTLRLLSKQIQYKQSKYLQLLFAQKSQPTNRIFTSTANSFKSSTAIPLRTQTQSFETNINFTQTNFFASKINNNDTNLGQIKTESSKYNLQKKIKELNQKIKCLEFQNNKKILYIQSVEQDKVKKDQEIKQLSAKINQMKEKISKVNQIEDLYNYKIKKLKEQLEVAHIVKEQNLAEKMKYILQID